ncbi:phage holin family protein [Bifidobacterium pseudolongum]|uniref:phage holin family protein n=1 Tax=Bifidobacterium pseudolongum TaxID=1694 RepID=UPI0022E5C8A0|nr:phage holin family protein [Bifidobacterium pseudolongum]
MPNMEIVVITCAFMIADITTGLIKAWHHHDIKSRAMREGLFHKLAFIAVIALAYGVELAALHIPQITIDVPLVTGICAFIVLTEIVSILENLCAINPQIAKVLNRFPGHPAEPDPTIHVETETTMETPASDAKEPDSATKHADLSDMTLQ